WDRLSAVGPFFTLGTAPPPPGAVPLAALRDGDTRPWERRLDHIASRLGTDQRRVAASLAYQGLASRLWSVALASASVLGAVPRLTPEQLYWLPEGSTPDDLWTTEPLPAAPAPGPLSADPDGPDRPRPTGSVALPPATAAAVHRAVHTAHLEPLAHSLRATTPIAPALLRGNSASALAGAGRQLLDWARRARAPRAAERAATLTAALLHHPGTRPEWTEDSGAFRRRSCCLYYRVPGGGLCGDCVLDRPPRTGTD
ncbi:(2Fe-2S)-binding protein, partial [Streptomyces lonarensis]